MLYTSKDPLLSLIVPHYNCAQQLPKLFDSVLCQSLRSLEVLLVDDCSTESYIGIIEAYTNKGLNLRLIQHEQNLGTHESRLTGIMQAKGRIIAFADADDYLYGTSALEYHADLMLKENADIVHFNTLQQIVDTGEQNIRWELPFAPALEGEQVFATYINHCRGWSLWNKLYSRELCLKNMDFCRSIKIRWSAEDLFLTTWFLFHAQRYRGSEQIGYFYNDNFNAKKYNYAAGSINVIYTMLHELLPFFKKNDCSVVLLEKCKKFLITHLFLVFSHQCEKLYTDDLARYNANTIFNELTSYVDKVEFNKALHYALFESQKIIKQQDETIQKQKVRIEELTT